MSPRVKSDSPLLSNASKKPFIFRLRSWISVLILAALAIAAHFAWLRSKPQLAQDPHFALTMDKIRVTPPPPWIRSDVKTQALLDANLIGTLSVLDEWETLSLRIKQAFEFHPWVASVT